MTFILWLCPHSNLCRVASRSDQQSPSFLLFQYYQYVVQFFHKLVLSTLARVLTVSFHIWYNLKFSLISCREKVILAFIVLHFHLWKYESALYSGYALHGSCCFLKFINFYLSNSFFNKVIMTDYSLYISPLYGAFLCLYTSHSCFWVGFEGTVFSSNEERVGGYCPLLQFYNYNNVC